MPSSSRCRADVDALQVFLEGEGATIVDPAGVYWLSADLRRAVFFLDPDGLKLEGKRNGASAPEAA